MKERERIRLSIQDRLLPGATLREKYDKARRYGFEAIELSQQPFDDAEIGRASCRERVCELV